ncbi:G/U mismatch-specific DNA glycosylase [Pontibacter harenae]|uniref:G/U mismatch-specific DNA glycosylase n=1 Tax=Pontibacter harenae TaxID=2894083 RepID=UPI001E572065|nr:G/U mismatch-specific DNA glycosylase [Pontibacter harenae]MCC9166620.1 G/U mismatch-specific DNA glycosylase [Pontibacter harenae]
MHLIKKPTKEELAAAHSKTVPDIIAQELDVLFCGINPSLYTAAVGHNFARPGNRFWPTLYAAGFTPRLYHPQEDKELLELGYGITNIVDRATTAAAELSKEELLEGGANITLKLMKYKPKVLAMLGISAYRVAFGDKKASIGLQAHTVGDTQLWVLPNPSGLNAHFPPKELARVYKELYHFIGK